MPVVSTKDGAFWRKQVDLAVSVRQKYEPWWDKNLCAYAPSIKDATPEDYGHTIHTNRTFTLTERKKADLFYQRPDVTLQPTPGGEQPIPGMAVPGPPDPMGMPTQQPVPASVALSAHQQIVNEKLGEDGVDATDLMDAVAFDIVATQGVGFTEMGYESFTVDVPQLDPMTGLETMVPVPIASHCFWEHFSGKQALIPADWRNTNWDKAPWLGRQFELPLTAANRKKYRLPPAFTGGKAKSSQHYDHGVEQMPGEDVFTGVVIWYRSIMFRDDAVNPDHYTLLILVDGIDGDEPVIHEDSPHQTLTPEGQLTPDSLLGNPIHPFSIRKLTDSAYVPSDGTMIRPLENELDVFRTQQVQHRDAVTLRYIANGDVLPKDALDKIVRSPIGGIAVIPGEAFAGDGPIKPLEGGSIPRESFLSNDYIDNDLARTTAIDASGAGVQSQSSSTATEQQIVAANANARLDKERGVLLKRYIKGVTKFSTLIQRYFPVADAAQIVGPQAAQAWDVWRKSATSSLAFTAMPDSALRVDQAVDRKQSVELYSFLANDPNVNRQELLTSLLRKHHLDPAKIVVQPPPQKPEPPKLALSFKGEDLVGPQSPIVIEILRQQGIQISEQALAASQTLGAITAALEAQAAAAGADEKHGGKAAQQASLSKHHSDRTGAVQGIGGAPGALGMTGGVQ